MTKIDLIAAARPNFMKIGPLHKALRQRQDLFSVRLIHTGQHYDPNMSEWFFRDLGLDTPAVNLGVGSGTHAEQTAGVMVAYEKLCIPCPPDLCVVVGDVNSTIACALTAKKMGVPVAHLEAGLRSRDRSMPEEINRLATDAISDILWTPSLDADENLLQEGVPKENISRVGNIMIDSFEMLRAKIESRSFAQSLGLAAGSFGVVTLHRPSNVDDPHRLAQLCGMLEELSRRCPLVFPVHPRTRAKLQSVGIGAVLEKTPKVHMIDPLGYVDFMSCVLDSAFVLTDSGGVQEETTYLGIPCLTLRESTERPITVTQGTNRLVRVEAVNELAKNALEGAWPKGTCPDRWDGRTAERVVSDLVTRFSHHSIIKH
jgi:UDP-N-acetylglucosamine 2-epimerase (non-hydrolysing)